MPRKPSRRDQTRFFYGQDALVLLELDPNQSYVAIAQLSAALGLERAAQERRVRAHALLAAGARVVEVDLEEFSGPALCLRVDLVPLWLVTLDSDQVAEEARPMVELLQREAASVLWQSFRPQGFGPEDELLPPRHEQSPSEVAFVGSLGIALLARQQFLIERQLANPHDAQPDPSGASQALDDPPAELLARAVRRVAQAAAERTRRNEYSGVYNGLYRQFGIASYRRMPPARLHEALEWLERWRGDLMGEPEPPPDI